MQTVISQDGTRIAYEKMGQGAPLILVGGALSTRLKPDDTSNLMSQLAPHFTVISYDRRGRGDSGDTQPYAVAREVEDIEALIDAVGDSAFLYGMSSGAVLTLEAANRLAGKVKKVFLYEPPIILDDSRPPAPHDYVAQLQAAIDAGNRGDAVEIFMTKAILIPAEYVGYMRHAPPPEPNPNQATPPSWQDMEKVAHTLAYDGAIMEGLMSGQPQPAGRWANNHAPTRIVAGGNSDTFFHTAAQWLSKDLPNGSYESLEGQDHAVAPSAVAPLVIHFFNA